MEKTDAGRDWGQEEKGTTEDEMAGWDHRFNGYEVGQTVGDGEVQGSLACCSPWGHEESDTTERLYFHFSFFFFDFFFFLILFYF